MRGARLEFGPGRHGIGEEAYCYARDPHGMGIEVRSGGRRNYEPDWDTVEWTPATGSIDFSPQQPAPRLNPVPSTRGRYGCWDAEPLGRHDHVLTFRPEKRNT